MLAAEVGGRWSPETAEFLCALATRPGHNQSHYCFKVDCDGSFTMFLLDRRPVPGTGADVPFCAGGVEALFPCDVPRVCAESGALDLGQFDLGQRVYSS